MRPVGVNRSRSDCTMETIGSSDRHTVRLWFRQVKGLAVADVARIVAARMKYPVAVLRRISRSVITYLVQTR